MAKIFHYLISSYLFLSHMYGAGRITTLPADSLNKSAQYLHFVCVCFTLHSEAKAFLERKSQTRQLNTFIQPMYPI